MRSRSSSGRHPLRFRQSRGSEMHTRSGVIYPRLDSPPAQSPAKRCFVDDGSNCGDSKKRTRASGVGFDFFDGLPDDLVLLVLCKLSASAGAPSDLISALLTCRRFKQLADHRMVLSKLSVKGIAVRAKNWSECAYRFLKRCAEAGSLDASYTLGMICFYCLENRGHGSSLMARAAMMSHPEALHSLAVIQFNGSGGSKNDKDLRAGVALCARAAYHGHIDALRELGHCLQDGYGVRQNIAEGRRFLVQANARELGAVMFQERKERLLFSPCSLLSDFGCNVPTPEAHPANRFMVEWFAERGGLLVREKGVEGLRMCSHGGCGRPETRRHEFRRCSVCGTVNYCSRACQAMHWKVAHKAECSPMDRWLDVDGVVDPEPDAIVVAGDVPVPDENMHM